MTDFSTIKNQSFTVPVHDTTCAEPVTSSKITLGNLPEVADKVFGQQSTRPDARWTKVCCTIQRDQQESECERGMTKEKSKPVIIEAQESSL